MCKQKPKSNKKKLKKTCFFYTDKGTSGSFFNTPKNAKFSYYLIRVSFLTLLYIFCKLFFSCFFCKGAGLSVKNSKNVVFFHKKIFDFFLFRKKKGLVIHGKQEFFSCSPQTDFYTLKKLKLIFRNFFFTLRPAHFGKKNKILVPSKKSDHFGFFEKNGKKKFYFHTGTFGHFEIFLSPKKMKKTSVKRANFEF